MRITNEGSSYVHNFTLTREVATATRHVATFCGFEPASEVDAGGVIGRIYNATASGARQLHDYNSNAARCRLRRVAQFPCECPSSRSATAARSCRTLSLARNVALDPEAIGRTYALARSLRDLTDLDFITRRSVADGRLSEYRTIVLAESPVLEPKTALVLEAWVRAGGTLIATTSTSKILGGRLYDNGPWRTRLFTAGDSPADPVRPTLAGPSPSHWVLKVGGQNDQSWITGAWNGPEVGHEWREIPGATMRWTGARCVVLIPMQPGFGSTVRLSLSAPTPALGRDGIRVPPGLTNSDSDHPPGPARCRLPASSAASASGIGGPARVHRRTVGGHRRSKSAIGMSESWASRSGKSRSTATVLNTTRRPRRCSATRPSPPPSSR